MNSLIPRLQALVKNLERDDLTTVEALLFDMTGNRVAAQMLERLLLWWPKATNPDGWIYKSQDEWWAELRVKSNELTKAKGALEMAGVIIQVKQAAVRSDKGVNGWAAAPVRHYRLDVKRFLHRLAATLATSIQKLAALMKKPFSERVKNDLSNGQKTITTSPQTNLQTDVVVQKAIQSVKALGINPDKAWKLVGQYGAERVIRLASMAGERASKNPAGWLIKALEQHWTLESQDYPIPPSAPPPAQDDPAKWDDTSDDDTRPDFNADPDEGTQPGEDTEKIVVPVLTSIETSAEASQWERAKSQMEIQLDRASFDTWVRSARFMGFADGVYTIGVANSYARDMCQHRMYRDLRRIVQNVCGPQKVELLFVVNKQPRPTDDELPLFKLAMQGRR